VILSLHTRIPLHSVTGLRRIWGLSLLRSGHCFLARLTQSRYRTYPPNQQVYKLCTEQKKPHIPAEECGVALQSGYFRGLGLCFVGFTGQTSLTHRTSSSISFLELPKVLKRVTGSPVSVRICTTNFPCPDKTRATCEYCGKPNRLSPFDRGISITETKLSKTGLLPFSCREISCRTLERLCNIC